MDTSLRQRAPTAGSFYRSCCKETSSLTPCFDRAKKASPVQWIALLADEFAGISKTRKLEKTLITGQTIDKQAACAVIARLGYAPQQFRGRSRELYIGRGSVHWHSKSKQEVVETLIRYSRPTRSAAE